MMDNEGRDASETIATASLTPPETLSEVSPEQMNYPSEDPDDSVANYAQGTHADGVEVEMESGSPAPAPSEWREFGNIEPPDLKSYASWEA